MDWWYDPLHGEMARFLKESGSSKLILVPRGHLKTSIVTVGYTIQTMLNNPNCRILVMNAVWDFSRKILDQIKGYLTTKSVLPDLFGQFDGRGSSWTTDAITIAQRESGTPKEHTIETAGVESSLTGNHYDYIVLDDLVVRENVGTRDQLEKVVTRYKDCLDLLDPGGKITVVGTRWHTDDLYGRLLRDEAKSLNFKPINTEIERTEWRKLLTPL